MSDLPYLYDDDDLAAYFRSWTDDQLEARHIELNNNPPTNTQPPGIRQTGPEWEAWCNEVFPISHERLRRSRACRKNNARAVDSSYDAGTDRKVTN